MSTKEELVNQLSNKFEYVSDKKLHGSREAWHILNPTDEKLKGDCEDFSLTLLYMIADHSILRFWWLLLSRQAKICFCTIRGTGHSVLRYQGEYADNIQRKFVSKDVMEKEGYKFHRWLYFPFIVAYKLTLGMLLKMNKASKNK